MIAVIIIIIIIQVYGKSWLLLREEVGRSSENMTGARERERKNRLTDMLLFLMAGRKFCWCRGIVMMPHLFSLSLCVWREKIFRDEMVFVAAAAAAVLVVVISAVSFVALISGSFSSSWYNFTAIHSTDPSPPPHLGVQFIPSSLLALFACRILIFFFFPGSLIT